MSTATTRSTTIRPRTATTATRPGEPRERDWSPIGERLEPRGLRHGDRVVAVATVDAHAITILGYGVYQHGAAADAEPDALAHLSHAIRAADRVPVDYEPLVASACRHLSTAQAESQRTRFHAIEGRRRSQPAEHRARAMLDRVHHRRRVRLDSGAVIDADRYFAVRADSFLRYSAGSIVTKAVASA